MLDSSLNVLPKRSSPSVAMVEASMSQHIASSRVSSHDSDLAIACHSGVSQVAKWGKLEDALSKSCGCLVGIFEASFPDCERERGTCDRDRRVTHVATCERSPRTEIENSDFQNICHPALGPGAVRLSRWPNMTLSLQQGTLICYLSLYSVCLCCLCK